MTLPIRVYSCMSRYATSLCLAAVVVTATGCTVQLDGHAFVEREEKRFPAGAAPDITLATFDGAIQVRPWDRPEVLVEIEKRGSDKDAVAGIQVVAEATDDKISVDVRKPASEKEFIGLGIHQSTSAKLIASVPRGSKLVVTTRDGAITVERIDGRLELRTDDGSVRVSETPGDVTIVTRDGSIVLERVAGRVDARTGDGSIRLTGAPTSLLLETRDGSVVVRAERDTTMQSDWSVRTGDGSVTVELPEGFAAEIDAETQDGSVRTDLPVSGAEGTEKKRQLRGKLGAGGKLLKVRTADGSIRLRTS